MVGLGLVVIGIGIGIGVLVLRVCLSGLASVETGVGRVESGRRRVVDVLGY